MGEIFLHLGFFIIFDHYFEGFRVVINDSMIAKTLRCNSVGKTEGKRDKDLCRFTCPIR